MADKQMTLNFLQVRQPNEDPKRKAWDVLHLKGNTTSVDSKAMKDFLPLKGSLLVLSAFAAAAYTCQYAILKAASSQQALIWIGCQGALAAFRLLYWISNISSDDPPVSALECAELNVTKSKTCTLS